MNYRLLIRSFCTALIGHLTAFLVMALLSWLALYFENPSSAVLPIAFVSLGVGAVVCGIGVRKSGTGILGALMGGGIYVLIPFLISCFGKAEFFSFGTRLLVLLAALTSVLAVVLLFPSAKKRKRRRKAAPMRRK